MAWKRLSEQSATDLLSKVLVDCSMLSIKSGVTYTEITFFDETSQEFVLSCTELHLPDPDLWEGVLKAAPIDLLRPFDQQTLLSAICLYSVMGVHKIQAVEAVADGDVFLSFTNGAKLIVKGKVDRVELEWELSGAEGGIARSEFGVIYAPES